MDVLDFARAVASLIYHQARLQNFTPDTDWMDAVLDELGEEFGQEL
jgi:hypothetical protein